MGPCPAMKVLIALGRGGRDSGICRITRAVASNVLYAMILCRQFPQPGGFPHLVVAKAVNTSGTCFVQAEGDVAGISRRAYRWRVWEAMQAHIRTNQAAFTGTWEGGMRCGSVHMCLHGVYGFSSRLKNSKPLFCEGPVMVLLY